MFTFAKWITVGARWLAGAAAGCGLLLLCYVVVTRYFFPHVFPDWGSEVVIYLISWALFLSIGEVALYGGHVNADFLVARFEPNKQKLFSLLASIFGIVFSGLFLYYGYQVVSFAHLLGEQSDSTLRFPKWIYYMALPTGMMLQCLGYLARFWCEVTNFKQLPKDSHQKEFAGD